MIVSINQPYYLPWCGYFDRIKRSDLHIVLDHVQLEKGGYTNRTRIQQRDGRWCWLTIPVEKGKPINQTWTMDDGWAERHKKSVAQAYGNQAAFCILDSRLLSMAAGFSDSMLYELLGMGRHIDGNFLRSSNLGGTKLGRKSDLVLNLCKQVGATQYLSGAQGRNYLDLAAFERAGIEVLFHEMPGDKPTLDYLFNPKEHTWPQAHLTSARSSPTSQEEGADHPKAGLRPV